MTADCQVPPLDSGEDLGRTIRRLLDGQLYAVLCTQGQGQPYGSLVAYATTPDLDSAVFATQKATRKYRLLSECPHVALVIKLHVTRFQEVRQCVPENRA